jgi:hypothetical protein
MQDMGRYEFRVAERLSPAVTAAFPELDVAEPWVGMVLYGPIRDRSELRAILERFELMGLTMLDVHRLPD